MKAWVEFQDGKAGVHEIKTNRAGEPVTSHHGRTVVLAQTSRDAFRQVEPINYAVPAHQRSAETQRRFTAEKWWMQ